MSVLAPFLTSEVLPSLCVISSSCMRLLQQAYFCDMETIEGMDAFLVFHFRLRSPNLARTVPLISHCTADPTTRPVSRPRDQARIIPRRLDRQPLPPPPHSASVRGLNTGDGIIIQVKTFSFFIVLGSLIFNLDLLPYCKSCLLFSSVARFSVSHHSRE